LVEEEAHVHAELERLRLEAEAAKHAAHELQLKELAEAVSLTNTHCSFM
jgi:hypothetical protein